MHNRATTHDEFCAHQPDRNVISDCRVGACVWAGTYTRSSAIADKLSLTNRAMLVCKVVEVWQDFLSEYVDKQFTRTYATDGQLDMNESIMAAKIVKFTTLPSGRLVRATSLVTASEVQWTPCTTVG